jgi:predicted RNA binding protein YcfA (HicA-like mRNA interferase family)
MPKKIRELKAMLRQAGWIQVPGGKGSHTKWKHRQVLRVVILSGSDGDDAKRKQERDIENAVHEAEGR